jgi:hypothetical protein
LVVASRRVEVGQQYRSITASGAVMGPVWTVTRIFRPWPTSFEHVRLECDEKVPRSMTFATSVLADRTRFVRVP